MSAAQGVSAFGSVVTRAATVVDYGDEPILGLDEQGTALLVEYGALDLFSVRTGESAGPSSGRWTFLFRAEAGTVLPPGWDAGSGRRVVAKPTPRSYISRAPVSSLADLSAPVEGVDGPAAEVMWALPAAEYAIAVTQLTTGLEKVLVGLAGALRTELPPTDFDPLEPRGTVTVEPGTPLRSVDGVQWVEVVTGSVRVGEGAEAADLGPGATVCLTERDWLSARGRSTLHSRTSLDLLADGTLLAAVEAHVEEFLSALDQRSERRWAGEGAELARYAASNARAVEDARRGFRGVLAAGDSVVSVADVAGDPPAQAAVRLVAGHLGVVVSPADVTPRAGRRMDPVRASFLAAGVRTRSVRLEGRWYVDDIGPLVGRRTSDDGPVALLPSGRGYLVAWPGASRLEPLTPAGAATLSEHADRPYPPLPTRETGWRPLLRMGLRGAGRDLRTLAVTVVLAGVVGLFAPIATGLVLGELVADGESTFVVHAGIAVVAAALGVAAVTMVQNIAVARVGGRIDTTVAAAIWDRLMALPVAFFTHRPAGALGATVLGLSRLREEITGSALTALLAWTTGLLDLLLVYAYSPPLGLATTVMVLLVLALTAAVLRGVAERARRAQSTERRLSALLLQLVEGLPAIRVAAAEDRAFGRWALEFARDRRAAGSARRALDRTAVGAAVVPVIGLAVLLGLVAGPVDGLSLAGFLTVLTAYGVVAAATVRLSSSLVEAAAAVPRLSALAPVLAAEPEVPRTEADPGSLEGGIAFTHVTFRYHEDGPPVLDDVSFSIAPGEFVAVVGPTGCGKSTLLKLLLRFDRPTTGSILFDGQDLCEVDVAAVRRQCGVVLQSGTLLSGDILTNIACGGNYTREEAWEAAELAGIADDIAAMPMGMETVVSEDSSALSGGQRQRLMIARALISKPRIVLLDEATSALDNPAQQVVADNTRRLAATRVVIAHRLSTIAGADRILVLDGGRLVQNGSYAELLADEDGLFARLARRQILSAQSS